jgi:hypothetical protein
MNPISIGIKGVWLSVEQFTMAFLLAVSNLKVSGEGTSSEK